ncbi:MAG: hypothetical protein ACJ749_00365 [Flavisolibacter sp.]|jgi:hypothetical protein
MADIKISKELQDTVKMFPHIEDVHFTASGEHFFNVHEHQSVDDKGKKGVAKKYGRLNLEAVHVSNDGDRKIYKNKSVPAPETEIVKSLSREEVLKAKVDVGGKSDDAAEKLKAENEELKKKLAEAEKKAADAAKGK